MAILLLVGCGQEAPPLFSRGATMQLTGADAARGKQHIERYGCVACHTIPGIRGPATQVGPPLANIAQRAYIGGVLPNTPDNLLRWLESPPAIDPRTAMPDMDISNAEAKDITAYLLTLNHVKFAGGR